MILWGIKQIFLTQALHFSTCVGAQGVSCADLLSPRKVALSWTWILKFNSWNCCPVDTISEKPCVAGCVNFTWNCYLHPYHHWGLFGVPWISGCCIGDSWTNGVCKRKGKGRKREEKGKHQLDENVRECMWRFKFAYKAYTNLSWSQN